MRLTWPRPGATGLLRVLLAASVLVPLLLFAAASWLNYRDAFANARRDLRRSSEVVREHASKVFEGQSQVADRVHDLVRGMDAASIARAERPLHDGFASIIAHLPQVQSVLLADRSGRPLVSAKRFPVPTDVDLRSRDYFKAVVDGFQGTFVSRLQLGEVYQQLFFGLARPWLADDGTILGVIDVAVSPSFFEEFYGIVVGEGQDGPAGKVITLIRDDGQLLVRYPPLLGPPPVASAGSPLFAAIKVNPEAGTYESQSIVDAAATSRVYSYRKVQGYPLYVVAGRSRDGIVAGWRRTMAGHLVFGLPATIALFAVTWTALVRAEREAEALATAHREIERRQLAEATLLKSQRLEAVGQMTGGVAHDFNNLLTVIMANSELLMRRAGDAEKVRHFAAQILLAAQHGAKVTEQLLTFSRKQFLKPETMDLNERLHEFRPLLESAASAAVRVEFDLATGLHRVHLDPGHFEAAILNLVGNARDAMPSGGRIEIATRNAEVVPSDDSEAPPGFYVRVSVADAGEGMDAATAAKAFEPFFTTKSVGKGTGLGLSQVYGFARQAGGDARIVSMPGKGTTVELLLPRATAQRPPDQAADVPPIDGANDGEVVLVVEDEPGVLETTVESLRDLGYVALTASTAREALDQIRSMQRIDVLFSDVVMPGTLNGWQLAAEARRVRPALKVLMTSGYVPKLDDDQPDGVRFMAKPYDRGKLATNLRTTLRE